MHIFICCFRFYGVTVIMCSESVPITIRLLKAYAARLLNTKLGFFVVFTLCFMRNLP